MFISENFGTCWWHLSVYKCSCAVALLSSAAVAVVEEATPAVGAAVGRTAEAGAWAFPSLFPLPLLPVSFQVTHEWCLIFVFFEFEFNFWSDYSGFSSESGFFSPLGLHKCWESFKHLLFLTKRFLSFCCRLLCYLALCLWCSGSVGALRFQVPPGEPGYLICLMPAGVTTLHVLGHSVRITLVTVEWTNTEVVLGVKFTALLELNTL